MHLKPGVRQRRPTRIAPDRSEVRGYYADWSGAAWLCSRFHRVRWREKRSLTSTIEELWYLIAGHGRMWWKSGGVEEVVNSTPVYLSAFRPGHTSNSAATVKTSFIFSE